MTTWWVYLPEEGFVEAKSRADAKMDLQDDNFLYDNLWSESMHQVCVMRCDLPLPKFDLGKWGSWTGERDEWIEGNGVVTDRAEEILVEERPEPPISLLAPWRANQLDDWWIDNWIWGPDCGREVDYRWVAVEPPKVTIAA